jgi:hypothetical protein
LVIALGYVFSATDTSRVTAYTQTIPNTVTAGVTNANVTLQKAVWSDDVVQVTAVTSNDTADTPAPNTYTAGSKVLNVIGLAAATTRTLYVTYNYGSLDSNTDAFFTVIKIFLIIVLLLVVIGGGWSAVQTMRGRR